MIKKLFSIVFLIFFSNASAQTAPEILWQKCLGGSSQDEGVYVGKVTEDGIIVTGIIFSNDGDVTNYHGNGDGWIVNLDLNGNIIWEKALGGSDNDLITAVEQTSDGGFIAAGYSSSLNGDVSSNFGSYDCWIIKLDSSGSIEWEKSYGGTDEDRATSIIQTSDGGYVFAAFTYSIDLDVTGLHGGTDAWIVKIDSIGNIIWEKCYGGSKMEDATSIVQTYDGGYVFAGSASSTDGDVSGNHGISDYWLVKVDSAGVLMWQKCFGGSTFDFAFGVDNTYDKGFIIAGYTESNDGDVSGFHGYSDYWVVKTDSIGNLQFQKCLGGGSCDLAWSVKQCSDSSFVVAGQTCSNELDVSGNHGSNDEWVLKLNTSLDIQWQKCLGGSAFDRAYSVKPYGNDLIVFGETSSNDYDVSGFHGVDDYWIQRLTTSVTGIAETTLSFFSISPNPNNGTTTLKITLSQEQLLSIKVIDVLGRDFFSSEEGIVSGTFTKQLDLSNLPSGTYFLRVINDGVGVQGTPYGEMRKMVVEK